MDTVRPMEPASVSAEPAASSSGALRKVAHLLAYPAGVISGAYVTALSVRKRVYKNFAIHGTFKDIQTERSKDYKTMIERARNDAQVDIAHEAHLIEDKYRAAVVERFEEMGMSGVVDYWKALQKHQKVESVVFAATVSGIAIGALLTIADSKGLMKKLTGQDETSQSPAK